MGFITCSKCNKLFNYEKYSGVCPHCGRYNRIDSAEEVHQELHEQYDTEGISHIKGQIKKNHGGWLILLLLCPGLVGFLFVVYLFLKVVKSKL